MCKTIISPAARIADCVRAVDAAGDLVVAVRHANAVALRALSARLDVLSAEDFQAACVDGAVR